jgi:CHASE4 domain
MFRRQRMAGFRQTQVKSKLCRLGSGREKANRQDTLRDFHRAGCCSSARFRGAAIHELGPRSSERGRAYWRHRCDCNCLHCRRRAVVRPACRRRCRGSRKAIVLACLSNYGERVLREVESVASSDGAIQHVRRSFDAEWARQRVRIWLATYFDHDYVFILGPGDELISSTVGHRFADMKWFATARPGLAPVINHMRGRDPSLTTTIRVDRMAQADNGTHRQIAVIRRLLGRPAVIAAAAVGSAEGLQSSNNNVAPLIVSVKFIDDEVLTGIAAQLRLTNLRNAERDPIAANDLIF